MPDVNDGAWTVPADDAAALRHRMPDLPDVRHDVDTPLDQPILTFTAAGLDARGLVGAPAGDPHVDRSVAVRIVIERRA